MDNPFLKRATEFYRDEEAFLAIVSPEPVRYFLGKSGQTGSLYDRLVVIRGSPGSGKTTLARLFEYPALSTLIRSKQIDTYQGLYAAMAECGALAEAVPKVVGYRLPMETDYREFWEFPYPDELKLGLMTAMIQARAVLGWVRNIRSTAIGLEQVQVVPRADAEAAAEAIGGRQATAVMKKAQAVESSLYKIVSALVPAEVSQLDQDSTCAYRPFDVIEGFRISGGEADGKQSFTVRPLIILDDAHMLHPMQFRHLQHWLTRRELRVARWILTRLDVLHPGEALAAVLKDRSSKTELPGVTKTRDTTEILLQSGAKDRLKQRKAFRRMARDMADRYLRRIPLFSQRSLNSLSDLLLNEPIAIAPGKLGELETGVRALRAELHIPDSQYQALLSKVDTFLQGTAGVDDVRWAMLRILMHRYSKRIAHRQNLFEVGEIPEPAKPLKADATVYDGGRIHLLHKYERPYYYGIDDLCDASSENAEQFLHLAAVFVEALAAQLIRSKQASLNAKTQNHLLREKSQEIIRDWNFPQCETVNRLTEAMAQRCLAVSLAPNAPLGAGANAFGVPQEEFERLPEQSPDLARTLQFAIAYNALSLVPRYPCKNKMWCLLELGGVVILSHGLTLRRGGFIESTVAKIEGILQEARP